MMKNILISVCSVIKEWPGFEHIAEKLYLIRPTLFQKACQPYILNDDDFITLLHADLWSNNLMFKYNEENELVDVLFVSS